jgi:DNA-binding response OmpR family regulator
MRKPRALVIEETGDILALLRFWLKEAGFEVAVAASLEAGLLELRLHRPAVILVGEVPGPLSCREFIAGLSEEGAYSDVPIVALARERGSATPLLRAGATHVLCLPADLGALVPTVCHLLEYPSAAVEAARYAAQGGLAAC